MKRETITQAAVFASLVAAGALSRICFRELPNFAPIAAMALFAGYYFRQIQVAALVPICAMAASDLVIGPYEWRMMAVVYGMLVMPVAFRGLLRSRLAMRRGSLASATAAFSGLVSCSLFSSILFFLATNFACWAWGDMYEHDLAGLTRCYGQALPFFRNTLSGDLVFGGALFGTYAVAVQLGWAETTSACPRVAQAASN